MADDKTNININLHSDNQIRVAQAQKAASAGKKDTESLKVDQKMFQQQSFQSTKFIQQLSKSKLFQNINSSLLKLVQSAENKDDKNITEDIKNLSKSLTNIEKIFNQSKSEKTKFSDLPQLFANNTFFKDIYSRLESINNYTLTQAAKQTSTQSSQSYSESLTKLTDILSQINTNSSSYSQKMDKIIQSISNLNLDNMISKEDLSDILSDFSISLDDQTIDSINQNISQKNSQLIQNIKDAFASIQISLPKTQTEQNINNKQILQTLKQMNQSILKLSQNKINAQTSNNIINLNNNISTIQKQSNKEANNAANIILNLDIDSQTKEILSNKKQQNKTQKNQKQQQSNNSSIITQAYKSAFDISQNLIQGLKSFYKDNIQTKQEKTQDVSVKKEQQTQKPQTDKVISKKEQPQSQKQVQQQQLAKAPTTPKVQPVQQQPLAKAPTTPKVQPAVQQQQLAKVQATQKVQSIQQQQIVKVASTPKKQQTQQSESGIKMVSKTVQDQFEKQEDTDIDQSLFKDEQQKKRYVSLGKDALTTQALQNNKVIQENDTNIMQHVASLSKYIDKDDVVSQLLDKEDNKDNFFKLVGSDNQEQIQQAINLGKQQVQNLRKIKNDQKYKDKKKRITGYLILLNNIIAKLKIKKEKILQNKKVKAALELVEKTAVQKPQQLQGQPIPEPGNDFPQLEQTQSSASQVSAQTSISTTQSLTATELPETNIQSIQQSSITSTKQVSQDFNQLLAEASSNSVNNYKFQNQSLKKYAQNYVSSRLLNINKQLIQKNGKDYQLSKNDLTKYSITAVSQFMQNLKDGKVLYYNQQDNTFLYFDKSLLFNSNQAQNSKISKHVQIKSQSRQTLTQGQLADKLYGTSQDVDMTQQTDVRRLANSNQTLTFQPKTIKPPTADEKQDIFTNASDSISGIVKDNSELKAEQVALTNIDSDIYKFNFQTDNDQYDKYMESIKTEYITTKHIDQLKDPKNTLKTKADFQKFDKQMANQWDNYYKKGDLLQIDIADTTDGKHALVLEDGKLPKVSQYKEKFGVYQLSKGQEALSEKFQSLFKQIGTIFGDDKQSSKQQSGQVTNSDNSSVSDSGISATAVSSQSSVLQQTR